MNGRRRSGETDGTKVLDVMTHLVVTLRPEDSIQDAARRMVSNRISGAPVVEDGRPVGIVSETDLVAAFAPTARRRAALPASDPLTFILAGIAPRSATGITVSDVMTRDVVAVGPEASLWEAASLIERHGISRLPVVDDHGYLVGIVARADLVRSMARDTGELSVPVAKR
ncbi:MAG: CBS domain-containing protein [Actinomycetota bacterium]